MVMSEKTSKRLRAGVQGTFQPGSSLAYVSENKLKYWASKGWITKRGQFYVLTKKGWRAA